MRFLKYIPCRYSRFVFLSGACISLGLLLAAAVLYFAAPHTISTADHIRYINMGKSCIDAAFAALVSVLIAAVIGEKVFKSLRQ